MNVVVACEYSGRVRDYFIKHGHTAISVDLEPCERDGPHWQGDIRGFDLIGCDLLIAHPPCTYLCYAGNAHWNKPGRLELRQTALEFVKWIWNLPVPRICIENPKGIISKEMVPYSQIIQPWWYGDPYTKATCLWLKNLPLLKPDPLWANKKGVKDWAQNVVRNPKDRSRTFLGIAEAMAKQWGNS